MNREKKIITIAIFSFATFIILAAIFGINYFLDKRVNFIYGNNKTGVLPKTAEKTKVSVSSTTASSSAIDKASREKYKQILEKQISQIKNSSEDFFDRFKTAEDCLNLKDKVTANNCLVLLAENKKDQAICLKADEEFQQDCYNKSLIAKAVFDKNIILCVNIKETEDKMVCLSKTIEAAGLTEKDCETLPAAEAALCKTKILTSRAKTVEGCNSITDASIKEACRGNFYEN
jgi:hypothetical protein